MNIKQWGLKKVHSCKHIPGTWCWSSHIHVVSLVEIVQTDNVIVQWAQLNAAHKRSKTQRRWKLINRKWQINQACHDYTMIPLNQEVFIKVVTLISGGTPPTKNTVLLGSRSNSESVPGASPFWMNFCSSVELWLGTVRKIFPCLPSLQQKDMNHQMRLWVMLLEVLKVVYKWTLKQMKTTLGATPLSK